MENEQTPAQSETPAPQAPDNEGIQRRIDQLVSKIHEKDEQLLQLQQRILEQAVRPQVEAPAPAPVDPLAQFSGQLDDTVARAVKAATEAVSAKFAAELARRDAQFQTEMSSVRLQQKASEYGLTDPDIQARADKYIRQYQTAPDVALKLAFADAHFEQQRKAAGVKNYVPPPTPVMTSGAPAPAPRQAAPSRPPQFDSLDPVAQSRWLEQNGFDDSPL